MVLILNVDNDVGRCKLRNHHVCNLISDVLMYIGRWKQHLYQWHKPIIFVSRDLGPFDAVAECSVTAIWALVDFSGGGIDFSGRYLCVGELDEENIATWLLWKWEIEYLKPRSQILTFMISECSDSFSWASFSSLSMHTRRLGLSRTIFLALESLEPVLIWWSGANRF